MDLKRRLDHLRQASGSYPAVQQKGPDCDLRQRVQRLQRIRGRGNAAPRAERTATALAGQVGGELIAEGLIRVERSLPLPHPGLAEWRQAIQALPEDSGQMASEWVFIDTETTGLAGGTGTVAFMLGMAKLSGEELCVRQYLLSSFAGEKAMLESAAQWLSGNAGLVSYNGKSFDLPLIKTRARLARLSPEVWDRPHLDLLHGIRRCFVGCWGDCRLVTAERQLLGIRRQDDLPGSEAPTAWLAWLRCGQTRRLQGVLDHNRQDLVSLAGLLPELAAVQQGKTGHRCNAGRIARAWLRQGNIGRARALLEGHYPRLVSEERLLLSRLRQRQGDRDGARVLLEELAARGIAEAIEQLAKYHEHISRDLSRATAYAQTLPCSPERERRVGRLRRKQGGSTRPLQFE